MSGGINNANFQQQYLIQHSIAKKDNNEDKKEMKSEHETWTCAQCKTINNQYLPYCENINCAASKDAYTDMPVCKCGTTMQVLNSGNCYSQFPHEICDICDNKIPKNNIVYHCPKKLTKDHDFGFDICILCKAKYKHRLKYFVALIICPSNHIHSTDTYQLGAMFTKLGFHKIEYLKGDDVTKQSVQNKLNELLPHNNEDSNQFTAICYSGYAEWIDNEYYLALNPNNFNSWISTTFIKQLCQPTSNNRIIYDKNWNKTYYRHNALLLMHSCHKYNQLDYKRISKSLLSDGQKTKSNEHESIFIIAKCYKQGQKSDFIQGCSNFVDLYIDMQKDKFLTNKKVNSGSPIMLFRYLQESLNNYNEEFSFDRIAETFLKMKHCLPEKNLILERKMKGAFGFIGKSVNASHEYIVITDPNTNERIRTEMAGQNRKHLSKHPFKNIEIKTTKNKFDDPGKTYEKYVLDIFNYPNLDAVQNVIDDIAVYFDFKSYNFGNRNCQTYGSTLTSRLYGITIEYVRIKDKHLMKKMQKVETKTIKLVKALDFMHVWDGKLGD
eukprot:158497_1